MAPIMAYITFSVPGNVTNPLGINNFDANVPHGFVRIESGEIVLRVLPVITDPSGECFWCIVGGAILDAVGIITGQPELVAIGTKIAGIGALDSAIGGITGCSITGC